MVAMLLSYGVYNCYYNSHTVAYAHNSPTHTLW